eukprot:c3713_g1_i1.p1 GENE.c3713_g1_i1~~c3713_g1_i1.p1  ORF type:complete len:834 (+),score=255.88 c3713_g1_i1:71-2503(+)
MSTHPHLPKGMFKGIRRAIDNISESKKPHDMFERHWHQIEAIYNSDRVYGVEAQDADQEHGDSKLFRSSLDSIVRLLDDEYNTHREVGPNQLESFSGPCFELLIARDVIPLLTAAVQTDRPPGMAVHTLDVLRALVEFFGDALLPHESVHKSINAMIKVMTRIVSDSQNNSPSRLALRRCLLRLLIVSTRKIQTHNDLGNFFFFNPSTPPATTATTITTKKPGISSSSSSDDDINDNKDNNNQDNNNNRKATPTTTKIIPSNNNMAFEFALFHSLIEFFLNGSDREQEIASGAILACVHFDNIEMARYIAEHTKFAETVCLLIRAVYITASKEAQAMRQETGLMLQQSVPQFTDADPLNVPANQISLTKIPSPNLISAKIAFYDSCVQGALEPLQTKMCRLFKSDFLEATLCREIFDLEEQIALTATNNLRELLYVNSTTLLTAVAQSIIQDIPIVFMPPLVNAQSSSLLYLLLQRIHSASVNISVATLSLFEMLVAMNRPDVMHSLVIQHLEKGVFTMPSQSSQFANRGNRNKEVLENISLGPAAEEDAAWVLITADELYAFLIHGEPNHLDLGPDYTSQYQQFYSGYMVDSETSISAVVDTYDDTSIQSHSVVSPSTRSVIVPTVLANAQQPLPDNNDCSAHIGPFLTTIFERVEKLLDQPFAINIAVSGVISRLAVQIDPLVHTFLMNHRVPVRRGVKSLPHLLRAVLQEASLESGNMQDYGERMDKARLNLRESSGRSRSSSSFATPGSPKSATHGGSFQDSSGGSEGVVRGAVVAEEIAKEMCAIVAAKADMRDLYGNIDSLYPE